MRHWIVNRPVLIAALLGPVLAFVLWTGAAMAQPRSTAQLDNLFAQLRVATDAEMANAITQQIWTEWTTPADTQLAGRMHDLIVKRSTQDMDGAIEELDQLIIDYPDYAEGWNQRATLRYLAGDYDGSLADIDKVLQLEPRHFGALVGRAMIYRTQGKQALAVKDMAAALALHPFLVERALFPELLDEVTRI